MELSQLRVDADAPIPLATQLSQQLALLIVSGAIGEGDRLPATREMAAHLGIHQHTVRAAYRQLEARGLVRVRPGSGTRVRAYDRARLAASAPDLPSFTIGVIIPEYNPFYAPLLHGIEAAGDQPSLFFICNAREDPRAGLRYLDRLIGRGADGIIVVSATLPPATEFPRAQGLPPLVFADFPGAPGPGVEFDLEGGTEGATLHLMEHGHRRIGFITPPAEWPTVTPLSTGFEHALRSRGLAPDPALVATVPAFEPEDGSRGAVRLLDRPEPPTAIFAASDTLAVGALRAIRSRGLRVPDDVALIGFDDIDMAAVVDPPLATVALPAREMGERAMDMLRRLMAGESPGATRQVLPARLVPRRSCGCATRGPVN